MYRSVRKSYLQMLDPVHNQGLRLGLGAFTTFPHFRVSKLYNYEAGTSIDWDGDTKVCPF